MVLEALKKVAVKGSEFNYKASMFKSKVLLIVGILMMVVAVGIAVFSEISIATIIFILGIFAVLGSWGEKFRARRFARQIDRLS